MDSDDEKLTKPKASKKKAPVEPEPQPTPPVKKERTEKQKEAFETARLARQQYLEAKNKKATLVAAKAELNGKTAKPKVLPNPVSQDSDDDYEKADESDASTEVEEVIYVKKAPKKKKKVVKKIIVEPSDDETDEEDEPEPPKPAKKKAKPVITKREEESEEEQEEVQVPTRNTRSQQNKNAKLGVATGKVNQRMLHYFMD